jgi:hypothetical protein
MVAMAFAGYSRITINQSNPSDTHGCEPSDVDVYKAFDRLITASEERATVIG